MYPRNIRDYLCLPQVRRRPVFARAARLTEHSAKVETSFSTSFMHITKQMNHSSRCAEQNRGARIQLWRKATTPGGRASRKLQAVMLILELLIPCLLICKKTGEFSVVWYEDLLPAHSRRDPGEAIRPKIFWGVQALRIGNICDLPYRHEQSIYAKE